jgi:hypothetical protein
MLIDDKIYRTLLSHVTYYDIGLGSELVPIFSRRDMLHLYLRILVCNIYGNTIQAIFYPQFKKIEPTVEE